MLFVLKKEEVEYNKALALAQVQLDKEKGVERFNAFREILFPWIETAKRRDADMHKKILADAVKGGALTVRALSQPKIRSRMVQHVESKASRRASLQKQDSLYKHLGKSIPV